jgi:hypothetical protein
VVLAALAGLPLAAGCQIIAGLTGDFHAEDAGTQPDAATHPDGSGGLGGGGGSPPVGCVSATYPDPPGGSDVDGGPGPIVFAIRTVDIGDKAVLPGYDLDHACTCVDDAGPTCVSPKPHCDGARGVDNGAAAILNLLSIAASSGTFTSAYYSGLIEAGKWSLLVKLEGYNGLPDDPSVGVTLYPSPGVGGATPAWDGNDAWGLSQYSFGDGGVADPIYRSAGAYVAGGVLVAAMPRAKLILGGSTPFAIGMTGGVFAAKLIQSGASWKLTSGTLAARWTLADVFQLFSSLRYQGAAICTDSFVYGPAKTAVCQGADILADGTSPKSLPCDAISFGMGFTADPAKLGALVPAPVPDGGCPAATDPVHDDCGF